MKPGEQLQQQPHDVVNAPHSLASRLLRASYQEDQRRAASNNDFGAAVHGAEQMVLQAGAEATRYVEGALNLLGLRRR